MKCPVCRAENNVGPDCRRCRTDLSLLIELERQRQGRIEQALRHARAGDWRSALVSAVEAHTMRQDKDSVRLRAMCHLMLRDFEGAWQAYQSVTPLAK